LVDWMNGLSAIWLASWLVDNGTWLVDWMNGLSVDGWLVVLMVWLTGLAALPQF
jgi:hypothetical protein